MKIACNSVGLRIKLVGLFLICFALTCSIGISILVNGLASNFAALENIQAQRLNDQLVRNFRSELEHLNEINTDWSNWGGMYDFAQTLSPKFKNAELGTGAIASAKLNFYAIFDSAGRSTVLGTLDPTDQDSIRSIHQTLDVVQRKLQGYGLAKACTIHGADGKMFFICWQQIHRSDGSGDSHGTLLLGRLIDEHVLQRIRNQSALDFQIESAISSKAVLRNPDTARGSVSTDSLVIGGPKHLLTGRILDAFGQPALTFHLQLPADIERSGRQITWRVVMVILMGASLSGLGLFLGVHYFLVRRLQMMERQLRAAEAVGGWPEQIAAPGGGDEIATLGESINRMLAVLRHQGQALERLSLTDPLTQLSNRRGFDGALTTGMRLIERTSAPLSLLVIDVDHFKSYNDLHGHPAGDQVLVAMGRILRQAASRPTDLAARIGGEEFAILLPNTTLEGAGHVAARIHEALAAYAIPHPGSSPSYNVSVSIGIAQANLGESKGEFVARADKAVYAAKSAGRDRTCAYEKPQPA